MILINCFSLMLSMESGTGDRVMASIHLTASSHSMESIKYMDLGILEVIPLRQLATAGQGHLPRGGVREDVTAVTPAAHHQTEAEGENSVLGELLRAIVDLLNLYQIHQYFNTASEKTMQRFLA